MKLLIYMRWSAVLLTVLFSFSSVHAGEKKCVGSVDNSEAYRMLQSHLQGVESFAEKANGRFSKFARTLIRSDIRGRLFRLEYMLKLISEHPDVKKSTKKAIKETRDFVKRFEDALGEYGLRNDLLLQARNKSNVDSEVIADLKAKKEKALAEVKVISKEDGWHISGKGSAYAKVNDLLSSLNWKKITRTYLLEAFLAETHSLEKQIKEELEPLILKPVYDYHALEDGFHKFRRNIRKVSIYMVSMGDFFTFAEVPTRLSREDQDLVHK
ncbi:MAG: hypothetical protein KDD61_02215 [Bdellovibrionales bacterium]|nr:hypothetical protein [Bdellovibrionales bacterium]